MSYKIAIASLDGVNIDLSFGAARFFDIYEVEQGVYRLIEKRNYSIPNDSVSELTKASKTQGDCGDNSDSCTTGRGCNRSLGGGCGGSGASSLKVDQLLDCRCIVCNKIGFNITKQLEKKAIVGFDVDCTVDEALKKITNYFDKLDSHQSLRGLAREKVE